MKKLLITLGLILLLVIQGCGAAGDPIFPLYTDDVLPGAASTYNIGSGDYPYAEGWFDEGNFEDLNVTDNATFEDQIALTGDGLVWLEFRPELDFDIVKKNAVPLSYIRGVFSGFELPIWADDDEELFFDICVPERWDGTSMSHIHIYVFLIDAQDAGDDFRLQIAWEHYNPGIDVVPATSTLVEVETATGASAAFQSYHVHFDIPAGDMTGDDILSFRLRRVAAVVTEIAGNVVIQHTGVIFLCDKLGNYDVE